MGSTASKKEEPLETKDVKEDERGDNKTSSEEEQEYKGDNQENKEPVIEEEIVPEFSPQVRSFLTAPGVSSVYFIKEFVKECFNIMFYV